MQQLLGEIVGRSSCSADTRSVAIQAKLRVSQPGDAHEREADRMADAATQMKASDAAVQRMCTDCEEERKHQSTSPVQKKEKAGDTPSVKPAVVENIQRLGGDGRPLPAETRDFFEPRFNVNFENVRVHTGAQAEEAADSIGAKAFTVENDIAFGRGQYSPSSDEGRELLAHELTHTVQQGASETDSLIVQRQPKGPKSPEKPKKEEKDKPAPAAPSGPMQQVYVVRDENLRLGGTLVSDLKEFKRNVMATKIGSDWTLVLSIHGSEERLGAQSGPDWQKNAVFYGASDIDKLFNGDKDFVKWRDQYGPTFLSLVSCQVSASFEGTLISNLTRAGAGNKRQPKRGLGAGCKPIATAVTVLDAPKTRAGFNKLPQSRQNAIREKLRKLNGTWGYYGAQPLPGDQVVHFYYDEEPKGEWVEVEVMVGTGHSVPELTKTGIPYWNRTTGDKAAEFRKQCDQGVGKLKREHAPLVPDVPE
ncbi:MAG: DUF4157 domain-containing protein [Acidobacteriota bacterium]|nr:DUF4157 domain-containing protein [Acidobacteriota bacterium]